MLYIHGVDLTELLAQQPDIKTLAALAKGNVIEWPIAFRRAMGALCQDRAVRRDIPARLMAAVIPGRGILLLWPGPAHDHRGFEVHSSPAGRRVRTDLTLAFACLGIDLPYQVAVAIPVTRYRDPVCGACLALHFRAAEFLPKKSRSAAGLQPED